ncbi:PEP-CTERM system TPR-repeat protein PrsT [Catenovulum sp. SM1970]|uniref:XrtA/PEP-CTERM system TPR-repeat protein PrsT n=1 Tax=Marinifaba aquimaris TaxID=2741323 RepID=UPI001571E865|nr:XrtA/PEP-CTERM system TPR-repeat protein PrsT [Marinifaba aquimaris]NTS75965.1 PEP-CTERM system TPR-repeat protein PrsT [Marinifaba aquimaris]
MKALKHTAITIGLCIALAGCGQKSFEQHYADAQQFVKESDYNAATIELKNAIIQEPENAPARALLGEIYFVKADFNSAEKELERAIKLGHENDNTYKLLARSYYFNNNLVKLEDTVKIKPLPVLKYYLALSEIKEGNVENAITLFSDLETTHIDYIAKLASAFIALNKKQTDQAIASIEAALASESDNFESLLIKGQLGSQAGKSELAVAAYTRLTELFPLHTYFQLRLASAFIADARFDKAKPLLKQLESISPDNGLVNQMLGQLAFEEKDFKESKERAEKSLQAQFKTAINYMVAGVSAYNLEQFEQAYSHLEVFKGKLAPEHPVHKLLIDLQFKLGYQDDALKTLNALDAEGLVDTNMLIAASNALLERGDEQKASELLQSSIDKGTAQPNDLVKQGLLQLKLDQTDAGIASIEKAVSLSTDSSKAEQVLAATYLANGDYEKVIEITKPWLDSDDIDLKNRALLLLSAMDSDKGQYESAKSKLQQVLATDKQNIAALYQMAQYYFEQQQFNDAKNNVELILTKQPEHQASYKLLLRVAKQDKKLAPNVRAYLEKEVVNLSEKAQTLKTQAQASFYITHQYYAEAQAPLRELVDKGVKGAELLQGVVNIRLGQEQQAIQVFEKLLIKEPNNFAALTQLLPLYEFKGLYADAISTLERAQKKSDNSGLDLYHAYFRSLKQDHVSERELKVFQANESTANHPVLFKTMGNIALTKAQYESAKGYYQKAYGLEKTPINVANYARATFQSGDVDSAISILEAHKKVQDVPLVSTLLSEYYLAKGNTSEAIKSYEQLLVKDKNNVVALNNLAYLTLQSKQYEKALEYAQQAFELLPQNPAVLDTYAQALAKNGKVDKALGYAEQAARKMPEHNEIVINKAKILIQLERKGEAKKVLSGLRNLSNKEQQEVDALNQSL